MLTGAIICDDGVGDVGTLLGMLEMLDSFRSPLLSIWLYLSYCSQLATKALAQLYWLQ